MAEEQFPLAVRFPDGSKAQARFPNTLRDRLKEAAASNHRSMNSEIVARLLASFGETMSEPETPPMTENIQAGRKYDQIMLRVPDGMREAIKKRAGSNARSVNSEIVAILATALNGEDDRLARIEAKLDALLNGGQA
ncbi:Arc family DNA-binding protein [Fulvimarina sp. 2208YS6-2-32]|uniref:Arc family DNA-binding protein n=1 Tax=Fulvimarina uroteuthidis TaxID=3098149 RepID=A0ABU5HYS8_9HYPH|nr:Arc family DNA-binding protein [Fulvimarina sp. 2208YS6-2-32]MDY8108286.1 Arc family DNA-binding protein [Fulvimarina sp. 2208YS6-2-32]